MNDNYIFIHGWGMDTSIWSEMSACFPEQHSHFLDLGFIGENENINIPRSRPAIYITHSLGTLWALKHHAFKIDALISINGFANFRNFVDDRTLHAMHKRLARSPAMQMESFWSSCGLNKQNTFNQCLNTDKLRQGLEWLMVWDVQEELNALSIPVLSLIGEKDPILPYHSMKKEWSSHTIETRREGDHILPLSNPMWCVQKIKGFISELELER